MAGIEHHGDFLRVLFPDGGGHADFHWFWLRHNCDCCRHPTTRERTICSSQVPMDLRPARVSAEERGVVVLWAEGEGGHQSAYGYDWLREHAYAPGRAAVAPPQSDARRIEVTRASVGAGPLHAMCMEAVRRYGAVVVRGAGNDTEAIIEDFAGGGFRVVETHFGRIEDLRTDNTTNRNTDQLGYTDAPVDLHTDQPFLEEPPHYQMLHCMQPAARGGENAVVDAFAAAAYLRSLDGAAFELLTTVPVRFLRRQKNFTKELVSPILEMRDGRLHRVRSSYFTLAPHRMPFETMEAWYRAYARFAAITNDIAHQYRFLLESGDFLLYDNFRMLHARTSFEGARWLRGVYFNEA